MNNLSSRITEFYMSVAEKAAELSRARRLKVGAVIVKDNNLISFSWNGTPAGWDNNCEDELSDGTLRTKPEVVHAEMNAILKISRSHESSAGADLYVTHSTCSECAKSVIQAGIKRVFYKHDFRDTTGLDILRKGGIEVIKLED